MAVYETKLYDKELEDMKFKELDAVRLQSDCYGEIQKGDIGVILMGFMQPHEAYEVEFLDSEGRQKAQYTLLPDEIEKIQ